MKYKTHIIKYLLIFLGTVSLIIGIIGIFIPLLPTTPFLLISAGCYIRSSDKLYNKLINSKLLGTYIKNYREKKGIPLKTKIIAISALWLTITYSIFFVVEHLIIKIILFAIATAVTYHILHFKTLKK